MAFFLDKAPLSKSLLLVPSTLSLLLTLLLPHCQKFFVYDLHAVKNDFQVGTLFFGIWELRGCFSRLAFSSYNSLVPQNP